MFYKFDNSGWYDGTSEEVLPRTTEVAPTSVPVSKVEQQLYPNWTGYEWVMQPYLTPKPIPELPPPPEDPRLWWIDVGPFKDRFDKYGYPGLKLTVLSMCRTSDICYGVFADLNGRLYIDLKGRQGELLAALGLIATELELAGKPTITPAMRMAMLTTPTTEAERYIKGL